MNDKNLIPCKPGEVRNPSGRPKAHGDFASRLSAYLLSCPNTDKRKTRNQLLVEKLYEMALKGNLECAQYLLEKIDGPIAKVSEPSNVITGNNIVLALSEAIEGAKRAGIVPPPIEGQVVQ